MPPRAAESNGRNRIDILNENKVDVLCSSHFNPYPANVENMVSSS